MELIQVRVEGRSKAASDASKAGAEPAQLAQALQKVVEGEVRFDAGYRALYATDASNYRHTPIGVVIPKSLDDVVNTVRVCEQHDVPLLSRGGGTSLAGQCCNVAVVMDFSKYLGGVLELNQKEATAWVLPGTILDSLRETVLPLGLTFGPDPATHNHCTLGGMIGNNSCGVHAVMSEFYGPGARTEDNVEALEILTYDGLRLHVGPTSEAQLQAHMLKPGRHGEIYRQLKQLVDQYGGAIRSAFPNIPRRVSGFNLRALLPERGFNVAQALVGTEGTCVTILSAKLKLIEDRPERIMVVLGFNDVFAAGDAIADVRSFKPIACEGMDEALVQMARDKNLHPDKIARLPRGKGWLLVEFGEHDQDTAEARAHEFAEKMRCRKDLCEAKVLLDPHEQREMMEIRESGLGATAFAPNRPDAWPGWEDAAVPPDSMGDYLREFKGLLIKFNYDCALYGHFAQGCLHTRIPFDFSTETGVQTYAAFTKEAAQLVARYGGSLSGEHGDGQARADLLKSMYSPEIMQAFREFKTIWDPRNRMNPGRIVEPRSRTEDLRVGPDAVPHDVDTYFSYPQDQHEFYRATMRCVGVGKCRRQNGGTMCPSYMATREEMHSTRGRAHALFEMLQGDTIRDKWASKHVKETLDLCLSCKGCKSDCPVNVDIATYKAEFLAHYHKHHRRERSAYAFGFIDKWAALASWAPELANLTMRLPVVRAVAKWVAGVHQARKVPKFAPQTFRSWFRTRPQPPSEAGAPEVILWPDTFNDNFSPENLIAATEVLEAAGCRVRIPSQRLCCGRPLYDFGFLDEARRRWLKIMDSLCSSIEERTPIVGIEPSCVSAFRDELVNLMHADERAHKLSRQVFTLAEFLKQSNWTPPPLPRQKALLHQHCHHKSVLGGEEDIALLNEMQMEASQPTTGCCGMAGSFGYESNKYEVSQAVARTGIIPAINNADPDALIITDGFSCREQIAQAMDRDALSLPQVFQMALARSRKQTKTSSTEKPGGQVRMPLVRALGYGVTCVSAAVGLVWLFRNARNARKRKK